MSAKSKNKVVKTPVEKAKKLNDHAFCGLLKTAKLESCFTIQTFRNIFDDVDFDEYTKFIECLDDDSLIEFMDDAAMLGYALPIISDDE